MAKPAADWDKVYQLFTISSEKPEDFCGILEILLFTSKLIFVDIPIFPIRAPNNMAMFKTLLSLFAAAAVAATTGAAHAFTLSNRDGTQHMFTIYVGDDEWRGTIGPSETLTDLCSSGCSIALNDADEEADFQGSETVMIIDGKLTVAESSAGGAGSP